MTRAHILFGEHSTQAPAIAECVDAARYDVTFASFDDADFASFDLVVPLRVEQFDAARAANADGHRRAVLPTPELLDLCDDKLAFNQRLVALGFGDLVPALLGVAPDTYPYIRKSRRGDYGQSIVMVRAPGKDRAIPDSFTQAAVEGADEEVLHLLRVDGAIRYALAYRYTMDGGLAVRGAADRPLTTVPADPEAAMAPCVAILDALGFEGTCCFNYKWADGRPMILELNPRFGGSLVGEVSAYLDAHLAAIR